MYMWVSWIFLVNDVIVNIGVILVGVMVYLFDICWFDLVIGFIVFIVVLWGVVLILKDVR